MRFLPLLLPLALISAGYAQTFDVATIRPAVAITPEAILAGKVSLGAKVDAGRAAYSFMSLRELIPLAYDVKPFQVTGPDWLAQQRFDIVAKMPEGTTREQAPAMLRALLEERFKLKVHRDKKERDVYALEQAKGGHKMKDAPPAEPAAAEPPKDGVVVGANGDQLRINRSAGGQGAVITGGRNGAMKMSMGANGMMHMEMERVTMAELVTQLSPMLDRPVVDHTGLTGAFQIALDLSMQDMMQAARAAGMGAQLPPGLGAAPGTASDPSGGSIFSSVQQLGLRLDKQKAEIENIVIDSVEKEPTEN